MLTRERVLSPARSVSKKSKGVVVVVMPALPGRTFGFHRPVVSERRLPAVPQRRGVSLIIRTAFLFACAL
jgi:hypothetical protein